MLPPHEHARASYGGQLWRGAIIILSLAACMACLWIPSLLLNNPLAHATLHLPATSARPTSSTAPRTTSNLPADPATNTHGTQVHKIPRSVAGGHADQGAANTTLSPHHTASGTPAAASTPQHTEVLAGVALTLRGFVAQQPGVPRAPGYQAPGGFWAIGTNHTAPAPSGEFLHAGRDSCFTLAARAVQPHTRYYMPRNTTVQPLFGQVPRAFYLWPGNISVEEFRAVPGWIRDKCTHCTYTVRYKILRGNLYRDKATMEGPDQQPAEEMMLLALHLFRIPDADLLLHFGDGCPPSGMPLITWNICRDRARAGFTMPSYSSYRHALGPYQSQVLHTCLASRYPLAARTPEVLWRGSTTDTHLLDFTASNQDQAARIRLHKLMRGQSPALNIKLSSTLNCDDTVAQQLQPLGQSIGFEDNNKAAVVLDMDGNGWSDRFSRMAHFNTPILKQASNFTGFFEHLAAPGVMLEQFANDLSDVKERALRVLGRWKEEPVQAVQQAANLQGLATAVLNHVALVEAMAFTLHTYASKLSWKVGASSSFHPVSWALVCQQNTMFPVELCQAARQRRAPSMPELLAQGVAPGPV